MTYNPPQATFLLSSNTTRQSLFETAIDKKLLTRREQFFPTNQATSMEETMNSELNLCYDEREKLFKSKRLRQINQIGSTESLIDKLSLPRQFYEECNAKEVCLNQLKEYITLLKSNSIQAQFEGLVALRKLLSASFNPPLQEIIDDGVIPVFLAFVDHPYVEFQYETLQCIEQFEGNEATSFTILGGISKIVKLLDTPIEEVLIQAMCALHNLSNYSKEARKQIIELKAYEKIISIISTTNKDTVFMQATFLISHICKFQKDNSYHLFNRALPYAIKGLFAFQQDMPFISSALVFISEMTENNKNGIATTLESGIVTVLFNLLNISSFFIQIHSLRVLGNIAKGDANQTQALIDYGLLAELKKTLFNPKKAIRKETNWILSNIAAGTQRQIEALITEGYLQLLLKVIAEEEPEIQKEAIWALCNITSIEKKELMEVLIRQGVTEALCQLLRMKDLRIIVISLEALENVLRYGKKHSSNGPNAIARRIEELGMFDVLEELQFSNSEVIYDKTLFILINYFELESS